MNPDFNDPAKGERAYELDRNHVFHSWSAQAPLKPFVIAGAAGSKIYDYDGNEYLDFSSQLVNTNIGHQHPKVIAAIQEQAGKLATAAPQHAVDIRGEAAIRIAGLAPAKFNKVFFTNGGADGVENAIRMARLHTGRSKVLSFYRSYHGNTGSSIAATGDWRRWPNEYSTGHVHFFGPFPYRSSFWSDSEAQETERALKHLEDVITFQGPNTIACVLIESVVGTAGVLVPPPGYLAGVKALCEKYGIIYIADEVMAGFGRTGKWFAFEHFDFEPDLIVFAKGVNSGYVPLGGVIISDEIAATFDDRVFPGGLTYSGHPLACAAAVAAIDAMKEEGIVENAARIGREILGPGLCDLAERHHIIGNARGLGVFFALDLVHNRKTKEPVAPPTGPSPVMAELGGELRSRGYMPFMAANRLHVVPPCIITDAEAKEGLEILEAAFTVMDKHYRG
jgi:taurine---2-oxoglutarate transaminase